MLEKDILKVLVTQEEIAEAVAPCLGIGISREEKRQVLRLGVALLYLVISFTKLK